MAPVFFSSSWLNGVRICGRLWTRIRGALSTERTSFLHSERGATEGWPDSAICYRGNVKSPWWRWLPWLRFGEIKWFTPKKKSGESIDNRMRCTQSWICIRTAVLTWKTALVSDLICICCAWISLGGILQCNVSGILWNFYNSNSRGCGNSLTCSKYANELVSRVAFWTAVNWFFALSRPLLICIRLTI